MECTFSPAINPNSERLLEDSRAVPSDFLARQRFFHDLKQQKLQQLQQTVVLHLSSKTQRAESLDFSMVQPSQAPLQRGRQSHITGFDSKLLR